MARSTIKPVAGPVTGAIDRDTVEIGDTVSLFDLFGQLAKTPMDIRTRLMIFADDCRTYLDAAKLPSEAGTCVRRVREKGFEHPSIEWYCANIVDLTADALARGERGDVWNAISSGCDIAKYSEQMRMLGYEPLIKEGIDKRNDLAAARQKTNRQRQKMANVWKQLAKKAADEIRAERPKLKDVEVARLIIGRGIIPDKPVDTIRKAIARPKQKFGIVG